MNERKISSLALTAILGLTTLSGSAFAFEHEGYEHGRHREAHRVFIHDDDHWRGGHWYHGEHGGHHGWWWIVGGAWHFFARPVYPVPAQPPVVIVQPSIPAPPPPPVVSQGASYYYCASSQAYYPNVPTCDGGWTVVPAVPPR